MVQFSHWQPCSNCNTSQPERTYIYNLLTFVALRDSAPLAGLARAASLSSESSLDSSGSLILITWLLFDFFKLEFAFSDRVTAATSFADVVRDFVEAFLLSQFSIIRYNSDLIRRRYREILTLVRRWLSPCAKGHHPLILLCITCISSCLPHHTPYLAKYLHFTSSSSVIIQPVT